MELIRVLGLFLKQCNYKVREVEESLFTAQPETNMHKGVKRGRYY